MGNTHRTLQAYYPRCVDVPAFLLVSSALLGVGLTQPLIYVTQLTFWKSSYSVLTGIQDLWRQDDYFLAGIIFLFSVIFPIVKLATLSVVWVVPLTHAQRIQTLRWLGFLGKWSMLDVFIVAITIVVVKLKAFTQVEPRIGVYLFSAAVFLSMVATMRIEHLARPAIKP